MTLGSRLLAVYLALCTLALGYALFAMVFTPGTSELSAVPLAVLSMPWSLLVAIPLMKAFRGASAAIAFIGIFGGIALNVLWLRRIGRKRN